MGRVSRMVLIRNKRKMIRGSHEERKDGVDQTF